MPADARRIMRARYVSSLLLSRLQRIRLDAHVSQPFSEGTHHKLSKVTMEVRDTVRLPSVGHCIYCGATAALSDEHILPLALGGKLVLPGASCRRCSAITSEFERRVLRGFMLDARTVGKFPTRRPKERPSSIPLDVDRRNGFEEMFLRPEEHPGLLLLPTLARPGLLEGRRYKLGVDVIGIETILFGTPPSEVQANLKAAAIRRTANIDATAFARLLAKIAYGAAVAAYGPIPLDEVPVLPLILGTQDDASHWLGSAPFMLSVEQKKPMHALGSTWDDDPEVTGRRMLVGKVKLFASSGATGYVIVVWRPEKEVIPL